MMEEQLRRAMLLSRGDATVFVTRPISGTLIAITCLILIYAISSTLKARRARQKAQVAGE
jgi:TctA family transporter